MKPDVETDEIYCAAIATVLVLVFCKARPLPVQNRGRGVMTTRRVNMCSKGRTTKRDSTKARLPGFPFFCLIGHARCDATMTRHLRLSALLRNMALRGRLTSSQWHIGLIASPSQWHISFPIPDKISIHHHHRSQ